MFSSLKNKFNKIENATFLHKVFSDVMDNATIDEIRDGKIFISEQTINEELAKSISQEKSSLVKDMNVALFDEKLNLIVKL